MTKKFKQLAPEQRFRIEALICANMNQSEIAENIGVHKCTISRAFNRNIPQQRTGSNIYIAQKAQNKTFDNDQAFSVHEIIA